MEKLKLIIAPFPHIRDNDSTQRIMITVLIALIPPCIAAAYFYGWAALRVILLAVISAAATEAIFQRIRRRPVTLHDGSALVTGLLMGLILPPGFPGWMVVLGSIVAIALGKQVFGGLGSNPFNPALVGRAFLTSSFAVPMTTWLRPVDGVSAATPLELGAQAVSTYELFFGSVPGSLGETSALAILIGGIFLFYRGVLDYRMPIGFLGTTALLMALFGQDPVFHLLAGSLLFAAVFMATDMVTTPVTPRGRWVFGIGAGCIVVVIRLWGSLPEGVTYAILLMNAATPLINRWTQPRIYGRGVKSVA